MVVLQVNKFFFEKGGTERYYFALGEALERRGHRVVHFAMAHPSNRPSPWSDFFVPRQDYDAAGLGRRFAAAARMVHNAGAAGRLRAMLREVRPDVAHLHNIYHQLTPSILDVLRARGIPVVMTLHDYKLICPKYSLFTRGAYCFRCRGGRFYHAALNKCGRGTVSGGALLALESYWQRARGAYDAVFRFIAPSMSLRERFLREGYAPRRVVHVPPFIPRGAQVRGRAGAGAHDPAGDVRRFGGAYAVYAGRLSEEKGLHTLIRAVARVDALRLVMCGAGPLREELEALARTMAPGRVHFVGHLAREELEAVVAGALVSVLPTRSPENAPYAVLEAAAAGVPVVVSNMGGLPEMARVVHGAVFECDRADSLAAELRRVFEHPGAARARACRGRDEALEHFSEVRHLATLEGLYAEAVGGRR